MSVEVDPPRGARPKKMIEGAQFLKRAGVDVINVADSPMARVRMSSIALASMITNHVGIETILHFTLPRPEPHGHPVRPHGRPRARDPEHPRADRRSAARAATIPNATAVFDVDSVGLIGVLKRLNAGTDLGRKLDRGADRVLSSAAR